MKNESVSPQLIKTYLLETRSIIFRVRNCPWNFKKILPALRMSKDNARLFGFTPIYRMFKSLEDLYYALKENDILLTDNLQNLIIEVADKIYECCKVLEENPGAINFIDVHPYLLYCDKALAGEIFDSKILVKPKNSVPAVKKVVEKPVEKNEVIKVNSSNLESVINMQEEMIAHTYIIGNQIDLLKNAIFENDTHSLKEIHKLLSNDSQSLQNNLLILHDQFCSLMHDDSFLKNHQEFQGFFIYSNSEKYLIPSQFIFDVICANPRSYITKQNQKYVVYEREDDSKTNSESEEIPVYSLSSLLPGKIAKNKSVLDTILLADYQSQKIGIIVDSMQKFVSIIKKPMPNCFTNFKLFQGIAFDEKYDMIPILYLPEIMKKFRAQRGYDVKKFEAYTKKHINKILIVDDSKTTREIQNTILSGNGFLVDEAVDGIDAMEKIRKKQFDLILSDDAMPRMNGDIFLENIRRMENYAKVPVIAISENPLKDADAFVCKADFSREELIQKINEVLHE